MKHPRRRRNRSLHALVSFFLLVLSVLSGLSGAIYDIETRKTYRAVLSEPKLVVPYDHSPPQATLGATDHLAESTAHLAVPQKRIRENTVPEPNDPPTQGFGLSQQKKRKKNQKGEKTIM